MTRHNWFEVVTRGPAKSVDKPTPNSHKNDIDQALVELTQMAASTCKVYTGKKALIAALFSWLFGK